MTELDPWRNLPANYAGRWGYDYDEKHSIFFVHCGGHRILDAEDSEVCEVICLAHNRDIVPGLGWAISEQTKSELKEIDDNIRSAAANSKNVVFD